MAISSDNPINRQISVPSFPSLVEFMRPSSDMIIDTKDFSFISEYILKYMIRAEDALFLTINKATGTLKVRVASGLKTEKLYSRDLKFGGNLESPTWRAESLLNIPDMDSDQSLVADDEMMDELWLSGVKSSMVAAVGDSALLVVGSSSKNSFSKSDEKFLKSTASQLGYIIESSEKIEVARSALEEKSKQLQLTEKIAFTSDLNEMMRSTLTAVHSVMESDTGSIMLLDEDGKELKVKAAFGLPKEVGDFSVKVGQGIAGWVAKTKKAIVINDIPSQNVDYKRRDLVSSISCPMVAGDKLIGVINIGSRKDSLIFSEEDIGRITKLISQASIAIDNSNSGRGLGDDFIDTMKALSKIIEVKDKTLKGHAERVAKLSVAVARKMSLSLSETRVVELAAILHDIGYAGVNSSIFRLKTPLSSVEKVLVKTHPIIASDALKKIPRFREVAEVVLHHHERYDGKGYVMGLAGEEIPLGARIIAVADAYDAMISKRSFRDSMTSQMAADEINQKAGTQFDPGIVEIFLSLEDVRVRNVS